MKFSSLGPLTAYCSGCGLRITREQQATAVMVRVWVEQARQYRGEGPFHADCAKRRDMQAQTDPKTPNVALTGPP